MGKRPQPSQGRVNDSAKAVIVCGAKAARLRFSGELGFEGRLRPGQPRERPPLRRREGSDGGVVFGLDVLGRVVNVIKPFADAAPLT
jgi:hypothetical protein